MKSSYRLPLCFSLFLMFYTAGIFAQSIAINEVMSANSSTLADEYGEFEDWIELYNYGTDPVDLEGYGLSDNTDIPFKWTFPGVTIQPGQFLLVWASGRDLKPLSEWRNGYMREIYADIPGSSISDLLVHPSYPENPTEQYILTTDFEAPTNIGDNYGQRMHGYLEAPATGSYVFWIASDDNGLLSLSTDEHPGNAVYIASVPGWTNPREYGKYPEQMSIPISLEQGKRYYIRALMKEAEGGDNLSIRWRLPSGTLQDPIPGARFSWSGGQLHTNFSISNQGEPIVLTRPDSVRVDYMAPVSIPSGVSYGRFPDGTGELYFFNHPTPGSGNSSQTYSGLLNPPFFSSPGGFYPEEFELNFYHTDPDVTIYYTLDGSDPSPDNIQGNTYQYKRRYRKNFSDQDGGLLSRNFITHQYKGSVLVKDNTGSSQTQTQINTRWEQNPLHPHVSPLWGTVVRARAVKDGFISSETVSNTYIIRHNPYSLPVVSLVFPEAAFFSYEQGIYVPGKTFDDWRRSNWNGDVQGNSPANFQNTGIEWERETNIEYFDTLGNLVFNHRAGARIHGGWSRSFPQKSIRLYAKSGYGMSEFNHQFFPDKPTNTFKRILMRGSGNDFNYTYFRDALIHRLVKNRSIDIQHWQPVVTFLNGEYWGILNVRDRNDNHYIANDYGLDPEKLDILTHNALVKHGDNTHYWAMMNYARDNDLSNSIHFDYINTQMDTDNFAEYYAIQIYINNQDWPHNNIDFWRYKTDAYQPDAPYGHDGRWRWMLYDTDFGFWIWGNGPWENTLEHATRNNWSTELFILLLNNQGFRDKMTNRFADMMNAVFHPDTVEKVVAEMQQVYEPEMDDHIARWHRISSKDAWYQNINRFGDYARQRPSNMRNHIQNYFQLTGHFELTLNVGSGKGTIRINTIEVENPDHWKGIYFNGVPVEVEAIPASNYVFSHWNGYVESPLNLLTINTDENVFLEAHFEKSTEPVLFTYWMLGDALPNNIPLESVTSTYHSANPGEIEFQSALAGYPFYEGHPNWRTASMERRNMPTEINYRQQGNNGIPYAEASMRGLQVKPPFTGENGENTLILKLPTNGYKNLVFSFAAKNESAADYLFIDYNVNVDDTTWVTTGLVDTVLALSSEYQLYQLNLSEIEEVNDNANFQVRIRFDGTIDYAQLAGRVSFNNFSLDGIPLDEINEAPRIIRALGMKTTHEDGAPISIALNQVFHDPEGDDLEYTVTIDKPAFADVEITNNILRIIPIRRGAGRITLRADDGINPTVEQQFDVLVYPRAHLLSETDFSFQTWNESQPELTYPENMLFLQSDTDDPKLQYPLVIPYHIPHYDYHANDQQNIGFPYNNTGRSRINALGEDGISFINTGRERDLGGALVAVNTKGQNNVRIKWTAGTLERNERLYAIRLQYRIGTAGPFYDVVYNGKISQYLAGADGEIREFLSVAIPDAAKNKDYVQFLWKYYHIAGESGARSQLRLDDIIIGDLEIEDTTGSIELEMPSKVSVFPNPAKDLFYIVSDKNFSAVELLDVSGKRLHREIHQGYEYTLSVNGFKSGIYILRVFMDDGVHVKKVLIQ